MKRVHQLRKRRRIAEELRRADLLITSGGRECEAIGQTIRDAFEPSLTAEERFWSRQIEERRKELVASSRPVTVNLYGAGSPNTQRSQEKMKAGVVATNTVGHFAKRASKSPFWCRFLFRLVRSVSPNSCIEMGTAVGVSGAYQAAALHLNGHGSLVTLEGAAALAEVAREGFRALDLGNVEVVTGRFDDTLPAVLERARPVDYAFIDGHHDEKATLSYFDRLYPALSRPSILVLDDIAWSDGMRRAWSSIAGDDRVSVAVDLDDIGVCVVAGSNRGPRYHRFSPRSLHRS